MRLELQLARRSAQSLDDGPEQPSRQEWERDQAEVERLVGEVKRVQEEKEAEARRCGALADRLKERDDELEQVRRAHEAETEAYRLALEELQLRLKCRPLPDSLVVSDPDPGPADPEVAGVPLDPAGPGDRPVTEAPGVVEPPSASAPEKPSANLAVVPGPTNPPDSPDERIAALRTYLRNVQDANKERLNKRLLRRLVRFWRYEEA